MGARRAWVTAVLGALLVSSSAVGSPTPTHVHFTAAGDYGQDPATTGKVLEAVAAAQPDLNVALGDLSYGVAGAEQSWCDFVTSRVGAGFPFELLSGNHESNGINGNINDFAACLPNQVPGVVGTYGRQYYVDVPQENPLVRFVMISPGITYPDGKWDYPSGSPRYRWTAAAIDGARRAGIPWTVVSMHKPCLSVGEYSCDPGPDVTNLLLSRKVDLVLSGHEHLWMRSKQLSLGAGCETLTIGAFNSACVTDADADLVAGAGTVFLTAGTGGRTVRDVGTDDPELPYFAATSGANANPTYGSADVDVTPAALTLAFLRGAGGTFSDAFTITRDPDRPNAPPSASYEFTSTDLTAEFDAWASADVDGYITDYSWDFGDGQTASGRTAEHTYAASGTYKVTLTVSDDEGATDSRTRSVSIAAPPGTPIERASVSTATNTTASSTVSVARPAGTTAGDVLVSCLTLNGGRVLAGGAPAGWTRIAAVTSVEKPHVFGFVKVAGPDEPPTYQWTLNTALTGSGGIARYTGSAGVDGAASTAYGAAATTGTVGRVQTTTSSAMLTGCMGINSGASSVGIAGPVGMSEAWDLAGKRQELDDQLLATAGYTGSRTWSFSEARAWAGWLVALRPTS